MIVIAAPTQQTHRRPDLASFLTRPRDSKVSSKKGFAKGVRRRVSQINFNETRINKLIMINLSDQSHQTNSCNLKQVCKEFQRTTCHLHRSCSSRLPRWDSLHEAMAPWIGASASERPWDSAFNAKTYPNLDIQHHPIYPISRSDSVSDFIRPGTPETMTSSS